MKKQEKKFVLAGFALLAITGLLALAGCKNDTVPEPTRYTVKFNKNAEDASGEMQSQIFTEGVEQELSANQFRRATYTFSGWSEDKAAPAATYKDKAKFKATKDTTLYAVWTDNGTVAPVNFSLPDGTKFYFGESIAVSLETTTKGATIQYHLGDGSWKDYDAGGKIQVTGDTTITAKATKEGLKPSTGTTATYTVRKLEGITVTPPARTMYSVGQKFDPTGMVVTATYDDKSQREVTGWETDFNTVAGEKGLNKPVTVSYTEGKTPKTTTFTVTVFPKEVKVLTGYTSSHAPEGEWTYVEFGEWPQTIKEERVEIGAGTLVRGGLTYYVGNDGNYYVKVTAKPYKDTYTYSDGNLVEKDKEVYFKVEPIVWRVLNKDYASTGNALLLAEKILIGGIKWADSSNIYKESYIRQWLNGNSGTEKTSDYNGAAGFLQTAFTESAQNLIADTTVDNSAASTTDAGNNLTQADGCSDTTDKIFLLSQQEATNSEYGFAAYDAYGKGSTRIRVTTDYAEATGANQNSTSGHGGWWWLRSPYYFGEDRVRVIDYDGYAINYYSVYNTDGGVVPALSISLEGN